MINEKEQVQESTATQALEILNQETPPDTVQAATEKPVETEAHQFRKLREEKERAQRERDELMRMMSQMNQQRAQPHVAEEPPVSYNPDDLVEWKVVNRELQKVRNELNQYKQQSHESMVETQLKAKYPDLDKVLSTENIAALKEQDPEVFNTIYTSSDTYSKGAAAYKLIKQMGIYKDDAYAVDKARALHNTSKPKPASLIQPSTGSKALGEASAYDLKLTPELKKRYQEEMMASSKKSNHFR